MSGGVRHNVRKTQLGAYWQVDGYDRLASGACKGIDDGKENCELFRSSEMAKAFTKFGGAE